MVRELHAGTPGSVAVLVEKGDTHYVILSYTDMDDEPWTLVYTSNSEGEATNLIEIAGGRGVSREEAIEELDCDTPRP
jgi:hypothetical protein